jgi:ABC-2 type transport system permease protein
MFLLINYLMSVWKRRQAPAVAGGSQSFGGTATVELSGAGGAVAAYSRPAARPAVNHGWLGLLAHQARYDLLASIRNPRARFFTIVFPLILLVIFTGVFGHGTTHVDGVKIDLSRYFVPGIMALSIITAAYGGLVIGVSQARAAGIFKRRRGTPVPSSVLIGGQVLATLATTLVMSAVMLVIARVAYGVGFAGPSLLAIAVAVVVGTLTFSCLGYAVAGAIGSPDSAQPVVQATMMPLYFISGVWIPTQSLPHGLRVAADVFPVEHLAALLHSASVHSSFTAAVSATDLLVLAAWGVAAAALAVSRFSWLPLAKAA